VDTPLYNLSDSKRRLFRALGIMSSAESVARKGLRAMNRRRRSVIPGLFSKLVVAVCAILPAVALLPVLKIPVIKRILDRL
jgi:short-subunit dehydrogenase